ncbi:hyaluronoglucosaminidase [Streptomyces sp. NPDC056488]|uniref:hyaluronoglucosaminidase n=1 Tax=unclassified Streptomyces TaxID=2593676 RepID=UPI0036B39BAA
MTVGRRIFLGGFTAGAVTLAAAGTAAAAPEAAPGDPTVFDGPVVAKNFRADGTANAAFLKTTSTTEHALTVYQAGTSGSGVALNIVSDNPQTSAVYLTGREVDRGTLKISHVGRADGTDTGASAISIDLKTAGTASQGIFLTATEGPTTGNLITLRNNPGVEDLAVKGSGRIGIGIERGATPYAQVHIVQRPTTPAGLLVEGTVRVGNAATVPTGIDSKGGGALYAKDGALYWRGSAGTVTQIASA